MPLKLYMIVDAAKTAQVCLFGGAEKMKTKKRWDVRKSYDYVFTEN